jgi:hypothetical protein
MLRKKHNLAEKNWKHNSAMAAKLWFQSHFKGKDSVDSSLHQANIVYFNDVISKQRKYNDMSQVQYLFREVGDSQETSGSKPEACPSFARSELD